jgi:hypothetical protein
MSVELLCKFVGIIALPDPQSQVDEAKVGRRPVKEGWLSGNKEGKVIEVGKVAKVTYPPSKVVESKPAEPVKAPSAPLGAFPYEGAPVPSQPVKEVEKPTGVVRRVSMSCKESLKELQGVSKESARRVSMSCKESARSCKESLNEL